MLEGGADIRFIRQAQIYTQVSIQQKQIHSATHPARLERSEPYGQNGRLSKKEKGG